MTAVFWVGTVALALALAWKLYQLARAPRDLGLRAVVAVLVCMVIGHLIGTPSAVTWLNTMLFPGAGKLAQKLFIIGSVFSTMSFFLISTAEQGAGRVRRELAGLAAVVAILVATTLSIPAATRNEMLSQQDTRHTGAALFFLTASLYVCYTLATAAVWSWRYAHTKDTRLRRGLRLVSAGLAITLVGSAARAVFNVLHWTGGIVAKSLIAVAVLLIATGGLTFLVGVSYPGVATRIAAIRVWIRHLRDYRRLGPLWTMLHETYPQDALSRMPPGRFDLVNLRAVNRRYYRRAVEIRDGLVRISPYLAQLRTEHPDDDQAAPEVLARHLRAALFAHAAGLPVGTSAVAVAQPVAAGLDDDVRQLLALSAELHRTTTRAPLAQ